MPRSYPDWSNVRREVSYILREDLAELAARLGSIDIYDRRGNLVWWDDFRHGLGAWIQSVEDTGAAIALSTEYPLWPPFCVKLTGGSVADDYVGLHKLLGAGQDDRLGLEVAVCFPAAFDVFELILSRQFDTYLAYSGLRLSYTDQKAYYFDDTGAWAELGDLPQIVYDEDIWHHLKLVVDFEAGTYVRFLLDDVEYDLQSYDVQETAGEYFEYVSLGFYFYSRAGYNDYCLVDGAIFTQEEP